MLKIWIDPIRSKILFGSDRIDPKKNGSIRSDPKNYLDWIGSTQKKMDRSDPIQFWIGSDRYGSDCLTSLIIFLITLVKITNI